MISKELFERIKTKYGDVASWAVWKVPSGNNLVSNMEVDGLFDLDTNPNILDQLNNNIIMVGYNFSIPHNNPPTFHNFHTYTGAIMKHMTLRNASKIRYAFTGTPYYGAYMTDIIKNHIESKSENVKITDIDNDFRIFRKELEILQADEPTIIAFGSKVYNLLNKHLKPYEYSKLIGVPHYSHYGDGCATHEGYKKKVLNQLAKNNSSTGKIKQIKRIDMAKCTLNMFERAFEIYHTEKKDITPLIEMGMNENSAKDTIRCYGKLLNGEIHTRQVPLIFVKFLLKELYKNQDKERLINVILAFDKKYDFREKNYGEPNISARKIVDEYRRKASEI